MMTEESELKDNSEFEISGYLQKKTTKGFYVNRYFSTFGHTLRYWQDQNAFDNTEKSSEVYDICDIKNIEKVNNRQFILYFLNEKFKLELKAASDEQCREWVEVLAAKRSMYSVDELLVTLDIHRLSFKTATFRTLLVLKEKDQNKFILDHLDDIFTAPSREMQSGKATVDSSQLIRAARVAIEELLVNCEECMLEMAQRNPKITVHCRTYIRRCAEIVKGRITLELLFLPGTADKQFEHMGEKSLCAAIELMTRVDQLSHYSFIPHDLVPTLNNTLFTTGQLISALLNLAINRIDAFVDTVNSLQPSLRSSKYLEIDKILSETMLQVEINLPDAALLKLVLIKLVTSQMLAFTDHVTVMSFEGYEESALIFHINTCDILISRFRTSYINLASRKMVHKVKGDMDVTDENEFLPFPPAVTDALNSACFISSRNAVLHAVHNMTQSVGDLTVGLLHERVVGWIGGDLCSAFIVRLDQWVMNLSTILPAKYSNILFVEVGRLMVSLYINNMIFSYLGNKSLKLSSRGMQQLESDLQAIATWLGAHITGDYAQDEKELLQSICEFLTCNSDAALTFYAKAVQKFGIQYSLHLYDLIRLVLKFRTDFSPKTRKSVLGLCGEYLVQLQKAAASDPDLICGSNIRAGGHFDQSIFEVLCPRAGVEHCTGKKWSVEHLTDPGPVKLTVSMLVTSTCSESRSAKNKLLAESSSMKMAAESRERDNSEATLKDAEEMPVTKITRTSAPTNQSLMRKEPDAAVSLEHLKKVTVVKKPKPLPPQPAPAPVAVPVPAAPASSPTTPAPLVSADSSDLSTNEDSTPRVAFEHSDASTVFSCSSDEYSPLVHGKHLSLQPETAINISFKDSFADPNRRSTAMGCASVRMEQNGRKPPPPSDLGRRPLPTTPGKPSATTAATAINAQNAAKAGLTSRPLPPPPPPGKPSKVQQHLPPSGASLVELLNLDQPRNERDVPQPVVKTSPDARPAVVVAPVNTTTESTPSSEAVTETTKQTESTETVAPILTPEKVQVVEAPVVMPEKVEPDVEIIAAPVAVVKAGPPPKPMKRPSVAAVDTARVATPTEMVPTEKKSEPVAKPPTVVQPQSPSPSLKSPTVLSSPMKEGAGSPAEERPALSPKEAFQLLLNKAKDDAARSIKTSQSKK